MRISFKGILNQSHNGTLQALESQVSGLRRAAHLTCLSKITFRSDAYFEVPTILFMIQSLNIWIFNLSTNSPSNKP